jgi:transcription elongation factor GreB
MIPPRAPLPDGVMNYVTPRGKSLLKEELVELESERERLKKGDPEDTERTRLLALNGGRLKDLRARLSSAKVLDLSRQSGDEVRFGATVTVETVSGQDAGLERTISIVGVDEADASEGRIAFIAPYARALMGLRVGDERKISVARGDQIVRVIKISYSEVSGRDETSYDEPA